MFRLLMIGLGAIVVAVVGLPATPVAAADPAPDNAFVATTLNEQAQGECYSGERRQPRRDGQGPHAGQREGKRDGQGPNAGERQPRRDGQGPHGERRRERDNEDCRRR